MKTNRAAAIAALLPLAIVLAACSSGGGPARGAADSTAPPAVQSGSPATAGAAPGAGKQPERLVWRGATVAPARGWRRGAADDTTLCLLATGSPDATCQAPGAKVTDLVFVYASERSGGAPGEPGHPETLDGSDMGHWMYSSGPLPCQPSPKDPQVEKGNSAIGGRSALYGKWQVKCADTGATFVAQRWLLPKSRLGIVSFALTEASTKDIHQMVTTMDLSGFQPTSPR